MRHVVAEPAVDLGELARRVGAAVSTAWSARDLPAPQLALEPGRALVGQAGVTLYRVRTVKRLDAVTWVAVDGGTSDNPRPQLYGSPVHGARGDPRGRAGDRDRERRRPPLRVG